jgi:3-hydroxyisobutyrate dehydrogenase-like beta-hydroxyacid dehydrogenase
MPTIALLGLGEAGSRLATDLVEAGVDVGAYDPAGISVDGVARFPDPSSAVAGCETVLSLTAAAAALRAARAARAGLRPGAIYADLNTSAPERKREVAAVVEEAGARFADVALLGTVPATGISTPALASGPGAPAFADTFRQLGVPVQVVTEQAGDAAAMKLLRSVFMKGIAAAAIESLDAAEAAGRRDWLEGELAAVLGEPLLERLLDGSRTHAVRRVDEMEAARDLLLELGIEPRITAATAALLAGLAAAPRTRER